MTTAFNQIFEKFFIRSKISNDGYKILLTLLACALLVDVCVAQWIILPPSILVIFLLSFLLYINPKHYLLSFGVVVLFCIILGSKVPRLANHGNLAIFTCAFVLLMYGKKLLGYRTIPADVITNTIRLSLIAIYFIAGFHKLNAGFFSLEGDCSSYISQRLNQMLFGNYLNYSENLIRIMQVGTIFIEMIVPFGILHRSTRKISIAILVIFHSYLSLCRFGNFSAFAAVLLAGCIVDLKSKVIPREVFKAVKFYVLAAILCSLTVYLMRRFQFSTKQATLAIHGLILNLGFIPLFWVLLKQRDKTVGSDRANILPFFVIMCILMWGLQGYVGLSNTSTLTMYSNLVTEQNRSNHFIVNTKYTKIWNFEEDYISIINLPTEDVVEWDRRYDIHDYDLPLMEFKALAHKWIEKSGKKLSCKIKYRGQTIEIRDISSSEFLERKWWQRFLYYRKIPKEGINECMW